MLLIGIGPGGHMGEMCGRSTFPNPSGPVFAATSGCGAPSISRRDFLLGSAALAAGLVMKVSLAEAQQDRPTRVGFILSGGPESVRETESLLAGFDLYVKERGGAPLEIVKKYGGDNEEKTPPAIAEILLKDEVTFLVGSSSLAGSEKCLLGLASGKSILFVTNPSVRLLSGEFCVPNAFRVRANTFQSSKPLAAWAVKNLGTTAFMTGQDDYQGNEETDFFAYGFEKAGGMFANRIMTSTRLDTVDRILQESVASKANFIFAAFRGKTAEAFLRKCRDATPAMNLPVIGPESLTAYPEPAKDCGEICAGVRTLTSMKDPVEFAQRIRHQTSADIPDGVRAAEGYDIAHIIHEACRVAGPALQNTGDLIKVIEQIQIDGPRGKIRFDNNHEPILEQCVQEWTAAGGSLQRKIVAELGTCQSLDFGCGRVGFPRKPITEQEEETEGE